MRGWAVGFLVGVVSAGWAQGSAADYERAARFGLRFGGKVLNERLNITWLAGGKAWYVRQLPEGKTEYVLVEPERRVRRLAFDHARVASALSAATGREFAATNLPTARTSFSDDAMKVRFFVQGMFEVDLKTYTASRIPPEPAGLKAFAPEEVTRSEVGGEATQITFVNQSGEPLKVHWILDDGGLREYQVIEPGKEWGIQTYVGHHWLVTRVDGTKLAVYKPAGNGGTAFLNGKRVAFNPPPRPIPGVSPDGKWRIRFEGNQAVLAPSGGGDVRRITTDGTAGNAYRGPGFWSPDSRFVAFYQVTPEQSRPLNIVLTTPPDQLQPRLITQQYLKPGDELEKPTLHIYRIGDAAPRKVDNALFPNPFNLSGEAWLDSRRFVFRYNQRGHQALRLIEVDPETAVARVAVNEESPTFIDWTRKSFYRVLPGGKEVIWQSERSGWSHLYLADLATGTMKPITKGDWVMRQVVSVDEERRQITFQASGVNPKEDPYHLHFYRVGFDGKGLVRLTDGDGNHRVQFSPDGKHFLATFSRADLPPVHELRRASDGAKLIELERADASAIVRDGFRVPRRFVAKGRDGETDIWGLVYLPTNFDPNKKYPVVEDIYAGPHDSHVPKDWHTNAGGMQVAELGFIVVRIDGMGTSNRSKAFHDVCHKNLADAGFPDRILWMKALAKEIPAMDLTRVGIYGTSAGGQNALHALLLHGDFYTVGVADCGCYDNRMDKIWWNEQWMGWPVGPHYEAQSGRTLAKNLTGKLLLLLGEQDTNVDPASTYQVVDALIKADKDFDFVTIPNVGHGAVGHRYGRRMQQDFLVRHLHGREPRWKD